MPDDEWLDVSAAAERHDCSTKTIRRYVKQGVLPARTDKMSGRDGRPVIKTSIRVSDLNDVFGWTARDEHVRKIRESAGPFSQHPHLGLVDVSSYWRVGHLGVGCREVVDYLRNSSSHPIAHTSSTQGRVF